MKALSRRIIARLGKRFVAYETVSAAAFFLDLTILMLLLSFTDLPFSIALAIGFFTGVNVNFFIQYFVVYAGTERKLLAGYAYFVLLAMASLIVVVKGSWFIFETFGIPFLAARMLMGAVSGTVNFLLNTFFNFKLV